MKPGRGEHTPVPEPLALKPNMFSNKTGFDETRPG